MSVTPDRIDVLHVDDEPDFAELAAEYLERADGRIEVTTASGGREGLDLLAERGFDCVVSDYDMPGMNGLEFLEEVREASERLPFVLFTGKGSEEVASDAISAGVTDYLQKERGADQYALLANKVVNAVGKTRAEADRQRQHDAIETAQEGISILDGDGRFIYVNEAYETLYGYESGELLGRRWETLYPDEEVEFMREEVVPTIEERGHWRGETTGLRADGTTFLEDHVLSATDHGELVCTVRDITERKARETELAESTTVLGTVLENLPEGVLVEDAAGEVRAVNAALSDVLGSSASPEDLVGRDCREAAEAVKGAFADPEAFLDGVEAALAECDRRSTERLDLADGRTVEREYVPYSHPGGQANLWIYRDVTARIEREERLNTVARRFDALFESPLSLVGLLSTDGTVLEANRTAREYLDASEDPTGRKFWEATWWSHSEALQSDLREWIERAAGGEYVPYETDHPDPDGTEGEFRTVNGVIHPVTEDGEVVSLLVEGLDTTGLLERERMIEALHEATRELLRTDDREAVAHVVAEAASDILGYPSNAVRLRDGDLLRPVAVSSSAREQLGDRPVYAIGEGMPGKVFSSGEPRIVDDFRELDDGIDRSPHLSALYLPIGEHGTLSIGDDEPGTFDRADLTLVRVLANNAATVLDRLEGERELERQNERLEQFASVVSHDLRNPLNVARGHLDLLDADEADVEPVRSALYRMHDLVEDVLLLSRAGRLIGERAPVDIGVLARDAWGTVVTEGATLRVVDPPVVEGDASRLRGLFENLFRNSVEHGSTSSRTKSDDTVEHGRADVRVRVGALEEGRGFFVADDGPGVPPDEREAVFQYGHSTSPESGGFGLSIVEQIADAHGWDVRLSEADGGGARFEFSGVDVVDG